MEALTVTLGNLTEGVMRSRMRWFSVPGDLGDPRPLASQSETASRSKASARLAPVQAAIKGGTMPFSQSFRRSSPARARGPVLAVGRRGYVARSEDGPARVTLTDDAGANALATLADGNEVEILAWRPRGSGTRYRVRSTRDGLEGWLGVGNLRSAQSAVLPAPTRPAAPATGSVPPRAKQSEASARRFGQRAH